MAFLIAVLTLVVLVSAFSSPVIALSSNYYDRTCLNVESIVAKAVESATMKDKKIPAALLRMHFHDCFIRGCDASVLLYSKGNNKAEKDGPEIFLCMDFMLLKKASCPGVVSCADIWLLLQGMLLCYLEVLHGMSLKEEKTGERRRLVKPYNCRLQPSTYLNCNKAFL